MPRKKNPSQKHQYQGCGEDDGLDQESAQQMQLDEQLDEKPVVSPPAARSLNNQNPTRIVCEEQENIGMSQEQDRRPCKARSSNGCRVTCQVSPNERVQNEELKEETFNEEELIEPIDLATDTTESLNSKPLHCYYPPFEYAYPSSAGPGPFFQPPPPFYHHDMIILQQQNSIMMQQQNPMLIMQQQQQLNPMMHPEMYSPDVPLPPQGMVNPVVYTATPSMALMNSPETTQDDDERNSRLHSTPKNHSQDQELPNQANNSDERRVAIECTAFDSTQNALQWAHQHDENPTSLPPSSLKLLSPSSSSSSKRNSVSASTANHKKGTQDVRWASHLEQLRLYKEEHGDCVVPRGYPPNPQLASWVAEQRKQYNLFQLGKSSSITPERIDVLTALDFAWNAQSAAWARQVSDLKSFKKKYGHCHVPLNHREFPKLGLWVKEQRRHYTLLVQGRPSHMTHARKQELTALGFCWDAQDASWLERLRQLEDYKQRHGTVNVPSNCTEYPKLATWVQHQRRQYKKWKQGKPANGMNAERAEILQTIGLQFHPNGSGSTTATSGNTTLGNLEDASDSGSCQSSSKKKRRCDESQGNASADDQNPVVDDGSGLLSNRDPEFKCKQAQQVSHVPKEGTKNVKHDDDSISYNPNDITWDGGGFDDDNHYNNFSPPSPEHSEKRAKIKRITEV